MARTYKKNSRRLFVLPLYSRFDFYLVVAISLSVFISVFGFFAPSKVYRIGVIVSFSLVSILVFFRLFSLTNELFKAVTIRRYITQRNAERNITKSLLATMSVNLLQDTPFISVPKVTVCDSRPSHISIEIEKLAGMYEIDKMSADINSSFRGKLSNYAVTSSMIMTNGITYKYILEDVSSDKTWRPATIDDIKAEKYKIKLQEGLTINLSERAMISCWGKTGSKKTTVLFGMILQLFSMGADVRFLDGKDEFSAFKDFYPADKIVSEVDDVLKQLDDVLRVVKERQGIMLEESRKRQKIGLKASEVGLRPVVLVADEIGSLVAQMDNKQSKQFLNGLVAIIQRGRSVGVSVFASTQDPSTDTLPQKIRQQFSTKILLGSANADIQRMAFGEVVTAGDLEDFRGFYTCDGLTNQPMKFFVCDLYSYGFNELGEFKKAYKLGLKVDYLRGLT